MLRIYRDLRVRLRVSSLFLIHMCTQSIYLYSMTMKGGVNIKQRVCENACNACGLDETNNVCVYMHG